MLKCKSHIFGLWIEMMFEMCDPHSFFNTTYVTTYKVVLKKLQGSHTSNFNIRPYPLSANTCFLFEVTQTLPLYAL